VSDEAGHMRIITAYVSNSAVGGASRRQMELIRGFLDKGWEVHHVSPRGFSAIRHPRLVHHAIRQVPVPPSILPYLFQAFLMMLWLGRRQRFHAVVTFSIFDGLLAVGYRAFHPDTKAILCDRGSAIAGFTIQNRGRAWAMPVSVLLRQTEALTYRKADLVIFNSQYRRREVGQSVPMDGSRTKVIYNNANPSWVNSAEHGTEPRPVGLPSSRCVGFVGNLYFQGRDLGTLVRAFDLVRQRVPDVSLVLVGAGPERSQVEALVQALGLEDRVLFTGWQSDPAPYMRAFDLMVVTALHESFSNTILEALYCGALVIGSRVGGIPEALKYDELLFPPQDVEALASRMEELLRDGPARERALRLIAQRRQAFLFDWQGEMTQTIARAVHTRKAA